MTKRSTLCPVSTRCGGGVWPVRIKSYEQQPTSALFRVRQHPPLWGRAWNGPQTISL